METLRDLPDIGALEDAGLMGRSAEQAKIGVLPGGEFERDERSFIE